MKKKLVQKSVKILLIINKMCTRFESRFEENFGVFFTKNVSLIIGYDVWSREGNQTC